MADAELDEDEISSPAKRSRVGSIDEEDDVVERETKAQRRHHHHIPVARITSKLGLPFGSVVKLHVKRAPWSFSSPWRRESQVTVTGTGFLLNGRHILTNAHVIEHHVNIDFSERTLETGLCLACLAI